MPIPFLIPLLMAGAGALADRKDPLRGAMIGGALGFGGAGLLGGAGAVGGTGAAATEGLLGTAAAEGAGTAAAGVGTEAALANSAGYLAPEMAGMASEQAMAPIIEQGTQAGMMDMLNFQSGGLLDKGMNMAKPAMNAMQTAQQLAPQEQPAPMPEPPTRQNVPLDLSNLLTQSAQMRQFDTEEAMRKRMEQQGMINKIGGGYGWTS